MRISLVTPLYRSEIYIEELYQRARQTIIAITPDYEFIFVNDNSPDNSLTVAKRIADEDPNVTVVDLSRNFGQHKALLTGLAQSTGDYVFICDSDLEEQPEWISLFYQAMQDKECDVIYGVQAGRKRGFFYRLASRMFYRSLNSLSGFAFPENIVTARLMSRRYVASMLEFSEREVFLAGIWHMTGFVQLPSAVEKPNSSPTTYSFGRLVYLFVNAITAFSTRPLTIISIAGIALSFSAMIFIAYLLWLKFGLGIASEGWASVMAAIMLIGGITLFFNGIMAIYIAKIFVEVKQRPLTIVREVYRKHSDGSA
ncbi:MAG: glycosyltransferase family 2 protein [Pseudomonadota bacterium]